MVLKEVDPLQSRVGSEVLTKVTTWKLDPAHSVVGFSVRHMMIANVRGEFSAVAGTLTIDPHDWQKSSVEVTIETSSISTRDENRDVHLKSADFFDVEQHPNMTFCSKHFKRTGAETFEVTGDLTIRGVTKEVVLKAEGPTEEIKDPWGGTRMGVTAKTKINRKDFGLVWNVALETGGILVGEDITITIDAQFVKQD